MNKIEHIFNKIDVILDKIMDHVDGILDAFFHILKSVMTWFQQKLNQITDSIFKMLKTHGKILRILSMPWGALIPITWEFFFKRSMQQLPIFQPGIHMFRGKVGKGKSLISFVMAEMELQITGMPSYFTSPVEKPQLSEDGKYWYVIHRVIKLTDYYQDGKKVLNFNTNKIKRINKDERHLDFNPRRNKEKAYNDRFIVEHEDHLLMRHDGMEWIGMYSQHMKLDYQDMDSITYMHEVETYKSLPVFRWIMDGLFRIFPTKIKIESYTVDSDFDGTLKRYLVKKYPLKISYETLQKYDTHAESSKHALIKKDYE